MTHSFLVAFLLAACVRSSAVIQYGRATSFPWDFDFFIFKTGVINSCLINLNKLF